MRGVDGFLICVCVREERQEENKRERERGTGRGTGRGGPVVKANRAPGKTHRGSLLTPIQEKGSKSAQRERRQPDTLESETPLRTERRDGCPPSRPNRKAGGRVRQ